MLEFWYEFASTYSYPAAMRIEKLAADTEKQLAAVLNGLDQRGGVSR